jgi:hypothetical protein
MAIFFFCKTHFALERNKTDIEEDFCLASENRAKRSPGKWFSPAWYDDKIAKLTLLYWRVVEKPDPHEISARALWREYIRTGLLPHRLQRIALPLLCYLGAASLLVFLLGEPHVPYRGDVSYWADFWILRITVFVSTALTFYVADATILNRRLIHYLTVADTNWPPETFTEFRKRRKLELPVTKAIQKPESVEDGVPPNELLRDYLDIDLIAKRTDVVSGLIYYPFFVLFLMIVSRMSLFDNWDWPLSLVLVLLFNGSYSAWSAFRLRNTAERAQTSALHRLSDFLVRYTAAGPDWKNHVDTIREMITAIRSERRGAFAAITQHPILGAILLPSGGLGIWAVTQYFPRFF